jgi:hypothetical protein
MAGAIKPSAPRAGAAFEVEQVEVDDGRLFVSGWWSGIRGMRFVRPTLLVGDRQVLATLEHKPWAPGGEEPWCAAFPWEGDKVDLDDVTLVVAPSITVPLGSRGAPPPPPKPEPPRAKPKAVAAPDAPAEPAAAAPTAPTIDPELTRLRARVTDLETTLSLERRATQDAVGERDAAVQARLAAERERDQALAQRDEAAAERDAAVRTRERMEAHRDEARLEQVTVEEERADVEAERDEARAQRDEVLLAHRTLERQLPAWRAGDEPVPEAGPDEPAGVRAIPATRTIAAHLHRAERAGEPRVSQGDLWAIRIFGTIASICFILLLVMILRAFL